jgi:hypothetical protein
MALIAANNGCYAPAPTQNVSDLGRGPCARRRDPAIVQGGCDLAQAFPSAVMGRMSGRTFAANWSALDAPFADLG